MNILRQIFNLKEPPLKIGDRYQGGIIAYFFQKGEKGFVAMEFHGLIAAPFDQSSGIMWNKREYKEIKNTGRKIGTGLSNTIAIVESQGSGTYAAKICLDLVIDQYNDWFLPCIDELKRIYNNRLLIGGFCNNFYWSSSQNGGNTAQNLNFADGTNGNNYRIQQFCVRAARTF